MSLDPQRSTGCGDGRWPAASSSSVRLPCVSTGSPSTIGTRMTSTDPGRTWAAAPAPWAVGAAYAVPLCVLPSAIWRLSLVFTDDAVTTWYMIFLSVLSMGLALSTLGLVHHWGQQVPHWVPLFGRRS